MFDEQVSNNVELTSVPSRQASLISPTGSNFSHKLLLIDFILNYRVKQVHATGLVMFLLDTALIQCIRKVFRPCDFPKIF